MISSLHNSREMESGNASKVFEHLSFTLVTPDTHGPEVLHRESRKAKPHFHICLFFLWTLSYFGGTFLAYDRTTSLFIAPEGP